MTEDGNTAERLGNYEIREYTRMTEDGGNVKGGKREYARMTADGNTAERLGNYEIREYARMTADGKHANDGGRQERQRP